MAKKKGGFGRFLGAITGTPYERLLKQIDKLVDQYDEDEEELANQLEAMVDQAGDAYEEEDIDEEEHDLIIEAIAERLDWKEDLYKKIAPFVNDRAILATNTSGLSITAMANVLPEQLRSRFLGIHFFNPPRYMALLELIPTEYTLPEVVDQLEAFSTSAVGKSVIVQPACTPGAPSGEASTSAAAPPPASAAAAPPQHWSCAGGSLLGGWETADECRALFADFECLETPAKMAKRLQLLFSPTARCLEQVMHPK